MDVAHNVTDIGWDISEHFSPDILFSKPYNLTML